MTVNKIITSFIIALFLMLLGFFNLKLNGYYNFYSTPILHDGRIKPLGVLIDYEYKNVLEIPGENKITSLARLFFNPKEFLNKKTFEIDDYSIKVNLGLEDKKNFNVLELFESFKKNSDLIDKILKLEIKSLNESQKKMLNIYYDVFLILDLSKSMDLILLNSNMKEKFNGLINNKYEFIFKMEIGKLKSKEFLMSSKLDFKMFITENNNWVNLEDFFIYKNLEKNTEMDVLNALSYFFVNNDIKNWSKECLKFNELTLNKLPNFDVFLFKIEVFYASSKFILNSCFCFLFCLIFVFLFKKNNFTLGVISYFLGFLMLFFDILFRIILTQKSPVTSLHESLIFVNFVFTSFFLFHLFKYKNYKYILLSAFNSFLLGFISIKLSEDGNIKSVVAVLNTNFWLIIHVLTISVGYGLCLIAGFLSHFYLYQILNKKYLTHKNNLYNYIFYMTLLALFFSFVGTLLGGIWADQSWGRFWGWDPKENGALLIVLWLTLILHAKFSNLISEINFIIGVFLNLIVLSLAWFGVNLLSVGLHSYGFIENIGIGLFIYITFEIFLLLYFVISYKKNTNDMYL